MSERQVLTLIRKDTAIMATELRFISPRPEESCERDEAILD